MRYFLDTDICIYILQGKYPNIVEHLEKLSPDKVKIPAIVKAELLLGAKKSRDPKKINLLVESFLQPFEVISFCDRCAIIYSALRGELEQKGQIIGPNDLLIASTVLAHQGTLITHNINEYQRIGYLKLQDWCV